MHASHPVFESVLLTRVDLNLSYNFAKLTWSVSKNPGDLRNYIPEDGSCKACKGLDGILPTLESENIIRWKNT